MQSRRGAWMGMNLPLSFTPPFCGNKRDPACMDACRKQYPHKYKRQRHSQICLQLPFPVVTPNPFCAKKRLH